MNPNEQKFANMVKENKSTIYTVCYMFSSDEQEVADLFQEVLIRLWNGIDSFDGRSDIKTWIYRVALNTCVTIDKKKQRRRKAQLSMDIDLFNDRSRDTEQARLLHRRIGELQPLDRAIVLLWLENLNHDQIGQIVPISTKNVSVRLVRIREQLKNNNSKK